MAEMRLYSAGASSEVELASALVLDWKESLALPAGPGLSGTLGTGFMTAVGPKY
jgi:hypothetical protein